MAARTCEQFARAVIRRIEDYERGSIRKSLELARADTLQASAASTPPLGTRRSRIFRSVRSAAPTRSRCSSI